MAGSPLIGCRMNLITKAEVRYEGILEVIDEDGDTVTLSNVRSFGTEKRRLDQILPASEKVHEYLTFRRSQIKELSKCDEPELFDPAIVQSGPPPMKSPDLRLKMSSPGPQAPQRKTPTSNQPGGFMRTASAVESGQLASGFEMQMSHPAGSVTNSESSFSNLNASDRGSSGVLPTEIPTPITNGGLHAHQNGGGMPIGKGGLQPHTRGSSPSIPSTASFDQSALGLGNCSMNEENFPHGRSASRGPPPSGTVDQDQDIYVDVNMPPSNACSRPISGASGLTPHSQNSRGGATTEHEDGGLYNQIPSPASGQEMGASGGGGGGGYYELDSTRSTSRYVKSSSSSHQLSNGGLNGVVTTHPPHLMSSPSQQNHPITASPHTSWENPYNQQGFRNGAGGTQSPMYASNTMESVGSMRYQSVPYAHNGGINVAPGVVAVNTASRRRPQSPDYVVYNAQRSSVVSERIITHSDTLNRFRYNQAPGGSSTQHRKPLEDYYKDESSDGEDDYYESEKPRPGIETMIPQDGEQVSVAHDPDVPDTLEGALHFFGTKCSKLNCISQIDKSGKIYKSMNYGALFSKAEQIAVHLTQTSRRLPNPLLKPGDRVGLVFPNWEPANFMCAFYGCQMAGVIPVPCDVPVSKADVGSDDVGFMLQNCNITVALTTSSCMKNFPKDVDGEIVTFKNWPRLTWVATDKIRTSVPRGWSSTNGRAQAKEIREAYIELTTDSQGVNKGVLVCKPAVDAHCEKLRYCCNYQRGETMVCIPDFRRDVGLWHGVLASVFTGIHVIFVPYALMKQDPMNWLYVVQRNKASSAIVKSRDLHWATAQVSQLSSSQVQIDLRCLKLLLMTDGSNPWAVSICDSFTNLFKARCGFRPEVLCPCATSTEALTVSIRRPNSEQPGRGCLNIKALSYGVVKIESSTDDGATVLTLQDSGFIMPTSSVAIIKPRVAHNWKSKEPYRPYLCKIDEVGEICLASQATAQSYWNFNGYTNNTFKVEPLSDEGRPIRNECYVRTGLLGFLGPSNLVFIVGKTDNVLFVDGRMHNSDDIVATILGVDPANFVFRGRVLAFTVEVKRRNKIVVICEQRNYPAGESDDSESQAWMQNVVQLIPRIHGVDIYCLALLPRNGIPKTDLNGLNLNETKKRFLQGRLNPCNILMQPMTCVRNLKPAHPELTMPPTIEPGEPYSMLVGGDPMGIPAHGLAGSGEMNDDNPNMQYVHEVLKWRGSDEQGSTRLFSLMNSKAAPICQLDASTLRKRAERLAMLVKSRCPTPGSHVAVLYPAGLEVIIGLYAVLYAGCIPVLIRAPASPQIGSGTGSGGTAEHIEKFLSTVKVLVSTAKVAAILTSSNMVRSLKNSKESQAIRGTKPLPPLINADETMRGRVQLDNYLPKDGPGATCYLDLSVSAQGVLQGVEITHSQLAACCRSMKRALELYPSRKVVVCLEPFSGMGLILWCFLSVFTGHETVLISPQEMEMNPAVWFSTLSQHSARDTFVSSSVIQTCIGQLQKQVDLLKGRGINLTSLRNCVVVTEERPRASFMSQFLLLFKPLGLNDKVLTSAFGCRVNPAVCFHCNGLSSDTSAVFVSREALRYDRIELVAKGSPGSLKLIESATILPGVKIVIANPYTLQQCPDLKLGEIWVSSQHNVAKFFTETPIGTPGSQLNAKLECSEIQREGITFARTGYLGFIRRTELTHADGERHDALYVVGSMAEKIPVRQGIYYPSDIEDTVKRACPNLVSESAVFSYSDMLVVVAEISAYEVEALNAIPLIVNAVIEEHNLIVGVVVLTDPCVIPFNPKGEKQRMTLRDSFISDEFMPIYVAYNL